jgi:hypothetical protein
MHKGASKSHPTTRHCGNLKRSEVSSRLQAAQSDGSKCDAPLVRNREDLALRSAILTEILVFTFSVGKYLYSALKAGSFQMILC